MALRNVSGVIETFHATADHRWEVDSSGWVATAELKIGDRIETGSKADVTVTSVSLTNLVERTYNLEVADWHTFLVGKDHVVVHNGCPPASSTIWNALRRWRGAVKTDGERYYEYDRLHGEIEVFNKRGDHLGAIDPMTGNQIKPPDPTKHLDVK